MRLDIFSNKILFGFSLIANCILIFSVYADASINDINTFWFSSDPLYLPGLYHDLFIDGNSIEGWMLNGAPNFFPDMPIFFILNAILPDFIWAAIIFPVVQYLIIFFLLYKLFRLLDIQHIYFYLNISAISTSLFFLSQLISNDFDFSFFMMINSFHMGSFINTLIALVLLFSYYKKKEKKVSWLLCMVIIIAALSDKLFIVSFCAPALIISILLLLRKEKKKSIFLIIQILLSTIVALKIFNFLEDSQYIYFAEPYRLFDFKNIISSFIVWKDQMIEYIALLHIKSLIILICFASIVYLLFALIKNFNRILGKTESLSQINTFDIYLLFSLMFLLFVLFTPILNGSYPSGDNIRYNFAVFLLSILNIGLLCVKYNVHENTITKNGFNLLGILILVYACYSFITHKEELKKRLAYYPEKVQVVDELLKDKNVEAGVADYWDAQVITMFSKNKLRVYSVFNELSLYAHSANRNWYYKKHDKKNNEPEVFNFIILCKDWKNPLSPKIVPGNLDTLVKGDCRIIFTPPFKYDAGTYDPVPLEQN